MQSSCAIISPRGLQPHGPNPLTSLEVSLLNGGIAPIWSRQQVWFVFLGELWDAQSFTVIKTSLLKNHCTRQPCAKQVLWAPRLFTQSWLTFTKCFCCAINFHRSLRWALRRVFSRFAHCSSRAMAFSDTPAKDPCRLILFNGYFYISFNQIFGCCKWIWAGPFCVQSFSSFHTHITPFLP